MGSILHGTKNIERKEEGYINGGRI